VDLIERGLRIFDEIIVAVAENPKKAPLFTAEERIKMAGRGCQRFGQCEG